MSLGREAHGGGHEAKLAVFFGLGLVLLTTALMVVFSGSGTPFVLAGLVAGLFALVVLDQPHVGVLTILLVWFVELSPAFLGANFLRIPYLVSAILVVPLGIAVLRDREVWVLRVPQVRILVALGALLLVSTWWNDFRGHLQVVEWDTTQRDLQIFAARFAFLVFFVYFVTTRKRIEFTVLLLVGATALTAVDSWGTVFGGGRAIQRAAGQLFDKNPNRLAFVCLFATALVWFYRSHSGRGSRFGIPVLFLLPTTALATGSRSGFLQALALAALVLLDRRRGHVGDVFKRVLFVGGAAVVLLSLVPAPLLERATTFDPEVARPGQYSLQNRMAQIESAVWLFARHPIFGIGIGNFESIALATNQVYGGVHNAYLRALTEGGIGTFALYLALFVVTYRMLRDLERHGPDDLVWLAKGLRAGLVLFLISSLTGDIWLSEHLYVIVALSIAMTRLAVIEAGRADAEETDRARAEAARRVPAAEGAAA